MLVQITDPNNATVRLNLAHSNLTIRIPEVKFDLYQTIASVKSSIERRFGTDSTWMQLVLQDANGNTVATMDEDDRNLGFYCPQDYYTIFVIDTNPNSVTKNLEDLSQVEKYMISDEDYDKLPDSFRKWKANFLKNNPELVAQKSTKPDEDHMKDLADKMKVGDRCKLKEADLRGEVKYVGKVPEIAEGYFVGVKLDEPMGKNNGTVKGTKYFDCPDKYGLVVRPDKIEVGDFPEIDLLDDEI